MIAVSGFYAECPSKNICFNASIWTKSKFYGMSIGVANYGEGESFSFGNLIVVFGNLSVLSIQVFKLV